MFNKDYKRAKQFITLSLAVLIGGLSSFQALAQGTRIVAPKNSYSVQDDVRAGRKAAAEVERQLPMLRDSEATDYLNRIGRGLVEAIPSQFQHPEFNYTFTIVNVRDINAFALPGGPMFVNRGMIEAAHNEGELAGVMAHELSHVALRHGTAKAAEAQKYSLGAAAGQILGAIVGGGLGTVIAAGTRFGVGTYFLKFSREDETQADLLGAQIMARAGYDPHDLANVFRSIQRQSGNGGPQWLSDHPDPGNRYQRINDEARLIGPVRNPTRDTREFEAIKARLRGMPRAITTQEAEQGQQQGRIDPSGNGNNDNGQLARRVAYPSRRFQTYHEGNLFQISVPDNWHELQESGIATFSPEGAHATLYNGEFVFTHGVQAGLTQAQARDLRQASDQFIDGLLRTNSYLRQQGGYRRVDIDGRSGLELLLAGRSPITGADEVTKVYTTQLRNGNLFYLIAVVPANEEQAYTGVFADIINRVRIND